MGLVPGAEDAVADRSVVVAGGSSMAVVVTCSGLEVSVVLDCIVVPAEVFPLEATSAVEKTAEVV